MSESAERSEKILGVRELERLIFLSFMHSQGNTVLQGKLVEWMSHYYGSQSEETLREAYDAFIDRYFKTEKFTLSEKNLHTASVFDIKNQFTYLKGWYETTEIDVEQTKFFESLFYSILSHDLTYIRGNGRPNRLGEKTSDSLAGKYFSFLKTYMIEGKPTGDASLDALYAHLKTWYETYGEVTGSARKATEELNMLLAIQKEKANEQD